jgi:hypothetical protein
MATGVPAGVVAASSTALINTTPSPVKLADRITPSTTTLSTPVCIPIVVGEKVTLILQEDCGDRNEGQLLVAEKPLVVAMLLTVIGIWMSLLVRVTVCDELVAPTGTAPKST